MEEGQEREGERKANVATQKRHRLQTNVIGIEEDAADREKSHRLDREGESGRRRTFCTELALLFDPVRRKKCNEHAAIPMLSCDSPLSVIMECMQRRRDKTCLMRIPSPCPSWPSGASAARSWD